MQKLRRKLILSVFSMMATIVCLTSTTYAWFARNENAWTEEFTLDMGVSDNLSISIDGVNFSNQLNNSDITKAIVASRLGKNVNDVTEDDIKSNKTILTPVTTYDLVNFTTVDKESTINNGTYVPRTADLTSYITFDIYFKVEGTGKNNYKLSLVSKNQNESQGLNGECYIKNNSPIKDITLDNTLVTCDGTTLKSGEKLTVNPLNAMRIGFIKDSTENNNVIIYEPYAGIGSYAIEGETAGIYNPDCNPMLTYFNNKNDVKLNPLSYKDVYVNSEKNFDGEVSLGSFKLSDAGYNVIKLKAAIWLEGYDADYFYGVDASSFSFFLNFVKIELGGNE